MGSSGSCCGDPKPNSNVIDMEKDLEDSARNLIKMNISANDVDSQNEIEEQESDASHDSEDSHESDEHVKELYLSNQIKLLDSTLHKYYIKLGRTDYFQCDSDQKGQFIKFVENNQYNNAFLLQQLENEFNPNNCILYDMDDDFPLRTKYNNISDRNKAIFDVIQYCFIQKQSPNNEPQESRERQKQIMKVMYPKVMINATEIFRDAKGRRHTLANANPDALILGPEAEAHNKQQLNQSFKQFRKNNRPLIEKYEREKYGKSEPNLTTFSDSDNNAGSCNGSINECSMISRLIKGLIYYQSLDIDKTDEQEKLIKFFHEEYNTVLDDYVHILSVHDRQQDMQDIFNLLISNPSAVHKCNIKTCTISSRHRRDRDIMDEKLNHDVTQVDDEFEFYQEIMDQVHYYVYHLYDTGLRIKNEEFATAKSDGQAFENMFQVIKTKKEQLQNFGVNENHKVANNKFNVMVNNANEDTFLDGLLDCVQSNDQLKLVQTRRLTELITQEQYDSDAIENDVDVSNNEFKKSNVADHDKIIFQLIKEYARNSKLHDGTFHIGYRLYYWEYYKKREKKLNHFQWHDNVDGHSSDNLDELYVRQKYADLKHELLHNRVHTLNLSGYKMSLQKAEKYMKTEKVKSITATPDFGDQLLEHDRNDDLHYGLPHGTSISLKHILAIILYCDWSTLCTKFSSTFRKIKSYHPLSTVIKRNREYANWSRLLRETVEIFGISWSGQFNPKHRCKQDAIINRLQGPFYCGMSFVMAIPQLHIRLCGPTSTSKKREIAINFGGAKGMLIQLNNTKDVNVFSDNICAFPCYWLSIYPEEYEYLFCGGRHRIRIENITRLDTRTNFSKHFSALFHFECVLNGMNVTKKKKEQENIFQTEYKSQEDMIEQIQCTENIDKECKIINSLIKYQTQNSCSKMPKYIINTFSAFVNHKRSIVINLPHIHENNRFRKLAQLITHKLPKWLPTYHTKMQDKQSRTYLFIDNYMKPHPVDILKSVLFKLFYNMDRISIYSTSIWGNVEYAFDISYFASSVFSLTTNINNIQIEIKAVDRYDCVVWKKEMPTTNWLRKRKMIDEIELRRDFNVEWRTEINGIGRREDCITVRAKKSQQYYEKLKEQTKRASAATRPNLSINALANKAQKNRKNRDRFETV